MQYVYPQGATELPNEVPLVEGQIDIIEIKSGKSSIPPNQKANYRKLIENGFLSRFFHVEIISFERNEFEIKEKSISDAKELCSFPMKPLKRRGKEG